MSAPVHISSLLTFIEKSVDAVRVTTANAEVMAAQLNIKVEEARREQASAMAQLRSFCIDYIRATNPPPGDNGLAAGRLREAA